MVCNVECLLSLEILKKASIEGALQGEVLSDWDIGLEFQLIFEEANVATQPSKLLRQLEQSAFCGEYDIVSSVHTQNMFQGRLQCMAWKMFCHVNFSLEI